MEVNGQFHAPAALPLGESIPGTYWIRGWEGPRAGLGAMEKRKILQCWEWNAGRPACSPSLYRLSYPGFQRWMVHHPFHFFSYLLQFPAHSPSGFSQQAFQLVTLHLVLNMHKIMSPLVP
jgi:hypothetical protein